MRTEERQKMSMQPTGEMYTVYLSNDGEVYKTAAEAEKRNQVLANRKLINDWASHDFIDSIWYRVNNEAELQTLAEARRQPYLLNMVTIFPAIVGWESGGDSCDHFYHITISQVRDLLVFLEGE